MNMNRNRFRKSVIALAISAASSTLVMNSAIAQQSYGALRGSVMGDPAAVTVVITDIKTNNKRTVTLDDEGNFRLDNIQPGEYSITVKQDGKVVDEQDVNVSLGQTTRVNMATSSSDVEEVMVTGQRIAAVDTGIAESGLVVSTGELNAIPVQRDLSSVSLLAPGVSKGDTAFGNNTSFSGSSVAENQTFINGLNITNFRNGLGFSKVPFEFYETIQVKTGGYSAKYGKSTGGVMNAVSKRGSNELHGGVNLYYDTMLSTSPNTYAAYNDDDAYDETNMDAYLSGPIIEDKAFFYLLLSRNDYSEEYYGLISQQGFKDERTTNFYALKLDLNLTEGHRLEATAFSDTRTTTSNVYDWDPATKQLGSKIGEELSDRGGDNWIVTYTGELTDELQMSASYGVNEADRTTAPSTAGDPVLYSATSAGGFVPLGNWTTFLVEEGNDKREAWRIDFQYDLGNHTIEAGYDQELNTSVNKSINSGGVYWLMLPTNDISTYQCDTATECPSGANARKRTYISGGEFEVENSAFYVQDTWEYDENLTFELGLRHDEFTNRNANGEEFINITNQWAPRLSAVLDPTGEGKSKVFANIGRYFLPIASNTNIRLSGAETYIHEFYDWDGTSTNADGTPVVNGAPYKTDIFGDGNVPDTRGLVDANIDAMYQDEFILGYQFATESGDTFGIKGTYRKLQSSIEDVAIDAAVISYYNDTGTWDATKVGGSTVEDVFTGFHQYVLTNPGNDMTIYIPEQDETINLSADRLGYPEAERKYQAIELTYSHPFDGEWSIDASYTWAKSEGNNEGYVRSDNGQDDAGLTTNFDQPGLTDYGYGYLPNDRRHTVKVRGTYQLTDKVSIGSTVLAQSGRPINCFGVHPTDQFAAAYGAESFYCNGLPSPRGSHGRTDNVFNLDLNAQYVLDLKDEQELTLSVDIFNVLDGDAIVEVQEAEDSVGYGQPTRYQEPRSIRVSMRYSF